MGISVVTPSVLSAANSTNATNAASVGALIGGDAQVGDFAGMLSIQLTDLARLLPGSAAAKEKEKAKPDIVAPVSGADDTAQLLAGMLAISPPPANPVTPLPPSSLAIAGISTSTTGLSGLGQDRRPVQDDFLATSANAAPFTANSGNNTATTSELRNSLSQQALRATEAAVATPAPTASIAAPASALIAPVTLSKPSTADFSELLPARTLSPGSDTPAPLVVSQAAQRPPEAPTGTLQTPLHDPRWSQELGDKVVWLARNEQQTAQININPPQLGPMQITINMNGDQATAVFTSPHAEVRQVIEDALPRLREILAGAGIDLGQTNVGAQLSQQNNSEMPSDSPRSFNDKAILAADASTAGGAIALPQRGRGLVDLFA